MRKRFARAKLSWCLMLLASALSFLSFKNHSTREGVAPNTTYTPTSHSPNPGGAAARQPRLQISDFGLGRATQLPYATLTRTEMGMPEGDFTTQAMPAVNRETAGRRVPDLVLQSDWNSPALKQRSLPLPEADTLCNQNLKAQRCGRLKAADGSIRLFAPDVVLIHFRGEPQVAALRVEPMRELEAITALSQRSDVRFAELNTLQQRQFESNDPAIGQQWQHRILGSAQAWEKSLGDHSIRIAIVDTPFQMDHPDLMANTVFGWSVVSNAPIFSSAGIDHSTLGAGMAAATINNAIGVAGVGNCQILPIHINGFTSEMYDAIIWAADHDVRVVNLSWSGADSLTLNEAGRYLREHERGLLAMAGVNGVGTLNYPQQPEIYCISMTDEADNLRSHSGPHIDFAAPGFQIFTTTTDSSYAMASGTSFSTPLFSGVVGVLLSINPTLSTEEVVEILKATADDKGPQGWDPFYGWGRIHFGKAAVAAQATLPRILNVSRDLNGVTVSATYRSGVEYSLWKSQQLEMAIWSQVANASYQTDQTLVRLTDPSNAGESAFYQIQVSPATVTRR